MSIWPSDRPFPTLGWIAIEWIECNTVHGPGDIRGKPTILSKGKQRFLLRAYEYHPNCYCMRDGCMCDEMMNRRVYKTAVFSRLKGSAKTELMAQIAMFELMGPARLLQWDSDDEPIGQVINSPYIPIAATSEEQAEDTLWGTFLAICRESPTHKLNIRERSVIYDVNGGEAKIVNSSSIRNDGGKPTFTGIDEAHLWHTPDLRRLHKALERNNAKRKVADPWIGVATTMFRVGEHSYAEHLWEMLHGKVPDLATLYDHIEAPRDFDTSTDDGLRDAIVAAADDAVDWLPIVDIMRSYRSDESEGERYWLNRYGGDSDKLVNLPKWRQQEDKGLYLAKGDIISLGVDGSMYSDATAVVACRLNDMALFPILCYYPDGTDEDAIRMNQTLNEAVRHCMSDYLVTRVYADPPFIQELIAGWSSYGLTLKQKMPTKVVSWWTNVDTKMCAATRSFVTAINRGECPHGQDIDFTNHIDNAYRRYTKAIVMEDGEEKPGYAPRKVSPKSNDKIDLCVTAILARQAAIDSIEADEHNKIGKRKRSAFASL